MLYIYIYIYIYIKLIVNALQLNELSALRNTFYPEYKYLYIYIYIYIFWLPVLLIFVSEKPPWGVDNTICIVFYCTPQFGQGPWTTYMTQVHGTRIMDGARRGGSRGRVQGVRTPT